MLPMLMLLALFQLAPLVWVLIHSLLDDDAQFSWIHYHDILASPFYRQAFMHSLWISVFSSLIGLIIATIGCASLRHTQGRLRQLLLAFTNMTSNFAGVPLAFAFIIILGFNGMMTLILRRIGWIDDFNLYSSHGLMLIYSYFQIPLAILLLYPAFDVLKDEWAESAGLLGASRSYYWRKIALPVLAPALLGTFIILLANGMGAYATAYALTSGNYNLVTIRIASLVSGDLYLEPNLAASMSVLLVILLTLVACINQWLLKRSYHAE
ncbi:ABC transporter permease subunit [Celerinatantimonas sp. YJH-8]